MNKFSLKNFEKGWIVGNFVPSLYNKNYEVGFKYYKLGDYEESHCHLLSEEVTIILLGEVLMNGIKYTDGDIIIQSIGEYTDFKVISDKVITAVYRPDGSFHKDKIYEKK